MKKEKKCVAHNAWQSVNNTLQLRSCLLTDLIRDTLTISYIYINIFGEMQLCDDLGLSQSDHTRFIALSELYYVAVHFLQTC